MERAEVHQTICIGGIEFEPEEEDGKESDYRMSGFFNAWAAYCGILIKLTPHALQGDHAMALSIYTMNIYQLLEKYAWEGVKAYHFQFHRKRVASGKSIYHAREWRTHYRELLASKWFAHPAPSPTWSPGHKAGPAPIQKTHQLAIRENGPAHTLTTTAPLPVTQQACRNWNYRECHTIQCRYQNSSINFVGNHQVPQFPAGNTGSFRSSYKRLN